MKLALILLVLLIGPAMAFNVGPLIGGNASEILGYTEGLLSATEGGIKANVTVNLGELDTSRPEINYTELQFITGFTSTGSIVDSSKQIAKYGAIGQQVLAHYPEIAQIDVLVFNTKPEDLIAHAYFYGPKYKSVADKYSVALSNERSER